MRNIASGLAVVCLALSAQGGAMAAMPSEAAWGSLSLPDAIYDRRVIAMVHSKDGLTLSFACGVDGYMALLSPRTASSRELLESLETRAAVTWRVDKHPPFHETWRLRAARDGARPVLGSFEADRMHEAISAGEDRLVVRVATETFFFPVARAREELDRARTACAHEMEARARR